MNPLATRQAQLAELERDTFDILVVGGGSVGAGVALDAAARGLHVALVERLDYASGASGRSTKLLHGGVRYLERAVRHLDRGEWHLVRQSLAERTAIFRQAPHLCRPLGILAPAESAWQRRYLRVGLALYDALAGAATLGRTRDLSAAEARRAFPHLAEGLAGGVLYFDGQFDDARLNLALILTAERQGAICANHVEVTGLRRAGGRVTGARVTDRIGGGQFMISARVVVNAAGPFADAVRAMGRAASPLIQPSSGIHLVLPGDLCPPQTGLLVPRTADGRVVFLLPWRGHTLLGTTDSPDTPDPHPPVREAEITYLLAQVRPFIDHPLSPADVRAAWSGIRPLVRDPRRADTAALARNHVVVDEPDGVLTVVGGKWTTYRRIARDTVDHLSSRGLSPAPPPPAPWPLEGAGDFTPDLAATLTASGLQPATAAHLASTYGGQAPKLLALAGPHAAPLLPDAPYLQAEVRWAAEREQALTVMDVLARRLRLAFLDRGAARRAVPATAALLGATLAWDRGQITQAAAAALAELEGNL